MATIPIGDLTCTDVVVVVIIVVIIIIIIDILILLLSHCLRRFSLQGALLQSPVDKCLELVPAWNSYQ